MEEGTGFPFAITPGVPVFPDCWLAENRWEWVGASGGCPDWGELVWICVTVTSECKNPIYGCPCFPKVIGGVLVSRIIATTEINMSVGCLCCPELVHTGISSHTPEFLEIVHPVVSLRPILLGCPPPSSSSCCLNNFDDPICPESNDGLLRCPCCLTISRSLLGHF
jgi:hypothetical protein